MRNVRKAVLDAVRASPGENPTRKIQEKYGISRQAVLLHLKALIADQKIRSEGKNRGSVYYPSDWSATDVSELIRSESDNWDILVESEGSTSDLAKKGEDEIYSSTLAPVAKAKGLSADLVSRLSYVSTEILNNVIDHSESETYKIELAQEGSRIRLKIEDDGIGAFERIRIYFGLDSTWDAIGEMSKGKQTSDPSRHAGEGLFFSARMADRFQIESNEKKYIYVESQNEWSMAQSPRIKGTKLTLEFDLDNERSTQEVFERFTEDFEFNEKSPRNVEPYIIALPKGHLPSRSEAKKILAGAQKFKSIVFDFKGVESIGQGFADEVFRVFQNSHPTTQIETKNSNEFIQRMIAHIKSPKKTIPKQADS